jgi:hypothetical protein
MTMLANLRNPVVLVWLGLVLATFIVWAIGSEHGFAQHIGSNLGIAAVLAIAFLKTQFVGSFFMDLRNAPRPLGLAFNGWVVGVGGIVIAIYLWA